MYTLPPPVCLVAFTPAPVFLGVLPPSVRFFILAPLFFQLLPPSCGIFTLAPIRFVTLISAALVLGILSPPVRIFTLTPVAGLLGVLIPSGGVVEFTLAALYLTKPEVIQACTQIILVFVATATGRPPSITRPGFSSVATAASVAPGVPTPFGRRLRATMRGLAASVEARSPIGATTVIVVKIRAGSIRGIGDAPLTVAAGAFGAPRVGVATWPGDFKPGTAR